MTHLLPQATSWASKLLGITGLDIRPYRWSVVTETGQWRGELTVEYLARGARLDIDAMRYRMQRRTRGLRETEFTLMAAERRGTGERDARRARPHDTRDHDARGGQGVHAVRY